MCALSRVPRSETRAAVSSAVKTIQRASAAALLGRTEAIANARLRNDQYRPDRIRLDLPSQVGNVNAQIRLRIARRIASHFAKDLLVGQRAAGMADERTQEIPFDG